MLWADVFTPLSVQPNRATFLPAADVTVSDSDLVLTLDLPGFTADDLEIEVVDGYLAVRGERKRPETAEGTRWAHNERRSVASSGASPCPMASTPTRSRRRWTRACSRSSSRSPRG